MLKSPYISVMFKVLVIALLFSLPFQGSLLHATPPIHIMANVDISIELKLYPNPTTDIINIEVQDLASGGYYEFRNIIGKRLLSGSLDKAVTTLNIEEYNKGIYLVTIFDAKGNRQVTKKVLKK